jgi:hypothetical protein
MNGFVCKFVHLTAVAIDYGMFCIHSVFIKELQKYDFYLICPLFFNSAHRNHLHPTLQNYDKAEANLFAKPPSETTSIPGFIAQSVEEGTATNVWFGATSSMAL